METQYAYHMNYLLNAKEEPLPLFPPRTAIYRPASQSTEICENDDGCHDYESSSPMRSVASLGTGSISTASTPDNVTTPNSTGLTAFDFHIDDKHVRGPTGPHMFRPPLNSGHNSVTDSEVFTRETPVSATGPYHHKASKFDPFRRDTPVPNSSVGPTPEPQSVQYPQYSQYAQHSQHSQQPTPISKQSMVSSQTGPHDWTPSEVVGWMRNLGFEDDIVETFFYNDISGSILLELQTEDLKELDIKSFGKRHRVMSSIQSLRSSTVFTTTNTASSRSRNSSVTSDVASTQNTSVTSGTRSNSCSAVDHDSCSMKPNAPRKTSERKSRKRSDLTPSDSVSIVAIEQLLPKLHQCSKGEGCRKWQKQQDKLARLAQGLPFEHFGSGRIMAGDPGNPTTAPNLVKSPTKSDISSSLVASSDLMGPNKPSAFQLSQEKLKEVKPRDPQENVRNFLNFQSLDRLQTANHPATPPRELLSSPDSDTPNSAKITPTLAEHLRHLPKLRIPSMRDSSEGSLFTENTSALRTVTPSILSRRTNFNDRTAIQGGHSISRDVVASPGDFYRLDPCYRSETPFSDADAPITAVPIGPVAREESQSVPPDMRFGNNGYVVEDPIVRSSTVNHRRHPSIQNVATLDSLKEDLPMSPIETPEDLQRVPRAPQFRNNSLFPSTRRGQDDITHSGWLKKRKTTRLICHEWEPRHVTLKGTQLSMHEDDSSAHRNSKALEYIDVDDYAVACSSFASRSKLTAAFKKTVLKRSENPQDVSAFSFSLIPAPNGNGVLDRKTVFLNSGKSHHFAVKTRDERIDWMRELMLAKALKHGRDAGAEVTFNGANMI
ncbi:unnamed protein product [Penicillium salamii]|uniref:SAM and PH domain protein n=1 Tax=Penicillium salamii TaxID=1612424 RepID=A0A9W4IPX3_9EURO|nr:unnamed protein product [Penicillium salamii]CAG8029547.1 unnamed protein product [Penicillium salamii]CAG8034707.1 unnamed protein product [Penicillium salamii]CAG8056640.1 unnamed protein product [Penicillium salamii]CAG8084619.1 unnamed protein product [Penicillium salamii]